MYARNQMFDWNILKQHTFGVPVIVVGNIAVGGTGKTPHVEFIINALRNSHHMAFLSRGYKRRTKGFVLATSRARRATSAMKHIRFFRNSAAMCLWPCARTA